MKKFILFAIAGLSFANSFSQTSLVKNKLMLPNGWSLSPAGTSLPLGDLPLNMAVSSSKKYIAVTNNGQSKQYIQLIDVQKQKVLDNILVAKSWLGIAFTKDEKALYVSGGNDNWILQYQIKNEKLQLKDSIKLGDKWPTRVSPAGLCIDNIANKLYVVTKDNNAVYTIDLKTKSILNKIDLPAEAYTCELSNNRKTLYISCWGASKLLLMDIATQKITN
jgi:DNA-binding beta-propeller fold protein YncE